MKGELLAVASMTGTIWAVVYWMGGGYIGIKWISQLELLLVKRGSK